jgi:hypothetical protein
MLALLRCQACNFFAEFFRHEGWMMAIVFIGDRSARKAALDNRDLARAGGASRNPKDEKKTPAAPPSAGGKGKDKTKPKGPAAPPKEGKADGIGRNPKEA